MSNKNIHVTDNVKLEGFQAILKPGKFGYSLSAVVDDKLIGELESERKEVLKWAESKLKNPRRSTLKPTPWEEVAKGKTKVKFSWSEDKKPPVVDTEGTLLTNTETPLYGGTTVKLGFYQKPYILKDGVTYGSSLKLVGVQVVELNNEAGVNTDELSTDQVSELFGTTTGFKATEDTTPCSVEPVDDEEDF
tara:strand:+ start:1582 stop:2154 length:573 start_codon:yes stop_codon:yes gene_type:complete